MIGTFIGIYLVQWELNLRFAFMYLIVVLVILLGNAIYVVYKRKKNSELGNEN
ncbi:hypothetical protein [Jeotgalibacillus proteolyticus]|uniref:hypothetical protein n=1 Tax=Jeotgalibacillus proteolyticus TaxID=2082395 RepID=UPI003CFB0856